MTEDRGREEDPQLPLLRKPLLLGFAGLYEFLPDPALPEDDPERWLLSCAVLTTTTQDALDTSMIGPRSSSRKTGSPNGSTRTGPTRTTSIFGLDCQECSRMGIEIAFLSVFKKPRLGLCFTYLNVL